ncbi:MAG: hypothetical protein ACYDG6_03895 [Thermincolia bacterium]
MGKMCDNGGMMHGGMMQGMYGMPYGGMYGMPYGGMQAGYHHAHWHGKMKEMYHMIHEMHHMMMEMHKKVMKKHHDK